MFVTAVKPVLTRLLCSGSQPQLCILVAVIVEAPFRCGGSHPDRSRFSGEGKISRADVQRVQGDRRRTYFSRATTNSGAQSKARLISESGKVQIEFCADSAYCAARAEAASNDP